MKNICHNSYRTIIFNASALIHAPFTPVHHSVTKQYYRQLSAEEAATFGFTSPTIRKQERRISQ